MSMGNAAMAERDVQDERGVVPDCLADLTACGLLIVDGPAILDGRGQHVARAQLRGSHHERTLLRWRGAVMAGPADVEVVMDDGTPALRLIRRRVPGVALLSVLDGRDEPVGRVTDTAPMTDEVFRLRGAGGLVGMMRYLGETWELDLGGHPSSPGWMTLDGRDRLVLDLGWGARPVLAGLALAYAVAAGTGLLAGGRVSRPGCRPVSASAQPPQL
jgi:hypothetical protein